MKNKSMDDMRKYFASSRTLEEAFIRGDGSVVRGCYCLHYTTLSRVYQKLATKRWWLTRAVSVRLNDTQECKKYGDTDILARMYQGSFSRGSAESAAMWVLYNRAMPDGVMISIGKEAMKRWRTEIKEAKFDVFLEYPKKRKNGKRQEVLSKRDIVFARLRDVVYAATSFCDGEKSKYDRKRRNILMWSGITTGEIENLNNDIPNKDITGWIKDYEWRHENETRIAVCLKKNICRLPEHISIPIPDFVIKSMRFTLSPWLKENRFEEVAAQLTAVVSPFHGGLDKVPQDLVKKSSIAGALDWWLDN